MQRKAQDSKSIAANSDMHAIIKVIALGVIERFSDDCRKNNTKVITANNQTGTNSAMSQSEFLAIRL